jgi:uncharacterized protein (DUF1919 family)
MIIKRLVTKLLRSYRNYFRCRFMQKKKSQLTNENICLISSNCNGGVYCTIWGSNLIHHL